MIGRWARPLPVPGLLEAGCCLAAHRLLCFSAPGGAEAQPRVEGPRAAQSVEFWGSVLGTALAPPPISCMVPR